MKLAFPSKFASPHTDLVSAVGWNLAGEVYSCSDDHTIWKWSRNGEALCRVSPYDQFVSRNWNNPRARMRVQSIKDVDPCRGSCSSEMKHSQPRTIMCCSRLGRFVPSPRQVLQTCNGIHRSPSDIKLVPKARCLSSVALTVISSSYRPLPPNETSVTREVVNEKILCCDL